MVLIASAAGGYLERAEPIILIGDSGTGKTHLATGLCVAACRQKKWARFVTAAGLVNELIEATVVKVTQLKQANQHRSIRLPILL